MSRSNIPTPSGVPTNDDDENFPSSLSPPTCNAPHAEITKYTLAAPAASIQHNSRGKYDHHMSSTSTFETALDQPVSVAVTDDSLVCDIVKGEICLYYDDTR